ncbi:MAG TPA: NADH-quinone oxidoreductase subunit C [Burkholderiales bacterium]|nr:NADH-quinone oxidoreductase subunit C [Burkholderiales bacterium]
MNQSELGQEMERRWPGQARYRLDSGGFGEVTCARDVLAQVCGKLFLDWSFSFAGLVVEEGAAEWRLRYLFYGERSAGWVHVLMNAPLDERTIPSIVKFVHAANWHERESEDLFGVLFEGHPHLGDFVLHDDAWQEGVAPMRHQFSAQVRDIERRPNMEWRPRRILEAPGAFAMPIGPVFSGLAESVHFLLETVGEDVIRALPRLFYKYRAIEKIAEGRAIENILLLAERFSATTAFAHALAFCQAVETICRAEVPARGRVLRVFIAELERFRHHVGAIEGICASTALVVAANQTAMLEEELLRVSGTLAGHRYLFGLAVPGGIATDLSDAACLEALRGCHDVLERLNELERMLRVSSSFLDRLEEVGFISEANARVFGLVGPIARASGISRDLRVAQPYEDYGRLKFEVPVEKEGDGYARLRVLFAEARESVSLMEQAVALLSAGRVAAPFQVQAGEALGWVEAPRGAAFHWLHLSEDGTAARYRIMPPSFANWHGFRLSVENFAFQDFPIILSTLDLSVAESDR